MADEVEIKILEITKGGSNRFNVKVQHKLLSADDSEFQEEGFSFKNEDLLNDNYLAKIQEKIKNKYIETVELPTKMVGKTIYLKRVS